MSSPPPIQTGASTSATAVRDLPAEVEIIRGWLATHPAVTANALSLEAGLSRNSLANLLRETDPEPPTANRLDKLYVALTNYGFEPSGRWLQAGLGMQAQAHLHYLSTHGCALCLEASGEWAVRRLKPLKASLASTATRLKILAMGEALDEVLTQAVKTLAAEVSPPPLSGSDKV